MAGDGSQRDRHDAPISDAPLLVSESHGQRTFTYIQDHRQKKAAAAARAQHVGRTRIQIAICADILTRRRLADPHGEGQGAEQER